MDGDLQRKELEQAVKTVFLLMMGNGHNTLDVATFADGRMFRMKVYIEEIKE